MTSQYPLDSVRALLDSEAVTGPTREVLLARFSVPAVAHPRFFTAMEIFTLRAVCARLVPQTGPPAVDIAGCIDRRWASIRR